MIDWVDEFAREWGRQKRRFDSDQLVPSVWGRIKDGWSIAAAAGGERRTPREVLTGDALTISVAIRHAIEQHWLTEFQHTALHLHYVTKGKVKQKMAFLHVDRHVYYDTLHEAHDALRKAIEWTAAVAADKNSLDEQAVAC